MALSRAAFRSMVLYLIAGLAKPLPGVTQVVLGGSTYTPAQLAQLFQSWVDLYDGVTAARASYLAKQQAAVAQEAPILDVIKDFRAFLQVTYSKQPDVLNTFGQSLRKEPTPLTVEEKAEAVALRKSTRAARHTTGPKAKLKIKGVVAQPAPSEPAQPTPAVPGAPVVPKP